MRTINKKIGILSLLLVLSWIVIFFLLYKDLNCFHSLFDIKKSEIEYRESVPFDNFLIHNQQYLELFIANWYTQAKDKERAKADIIDVFDRCEKAAPTEDLRSVCYFINYDLLWKRNEELSNFSTWIVQSLISLGEVQKIVENTDDFILEDREYKNETTIKPPLDAIFSFIRSETKVGSMIFGFTGKDRDTSTPREKAFRKQFYWDNILFIAKNTDSHWQQFANVETNTDLKIEGKIIAPAKPIAITKVDNKLTLLITSPLSLSIEKKRADSSLQHLFQIFELQEQGNWELKSCFLEKDFKGSYFSHYSDYDYYLAQEKELLPIEKCIGISEVITI